MRWRSGFGCPRCGLDESDGVGHGVTTLGLRVSVHRHERRRDGVMPSASTVMHQLAWELIPSPQGIHAEEFHVETSSS
jgi:hypothetical protein